MKHHRLDNMIKGWFVGNFEPTALRTPNVEVGVKSYAAGSYEAEHVHKVATELTLILSGEAEMAGKMWRAGDIVTIEPDQSSSFRAITDVVTVVVKLPSVLGDKYLVAASES